MMCQTYLKTLCSKSAIKVACSNYLDDKTLDTDDILMGNNFFIFILAFMVLKKMTNYINFVV